MLRDAQKAPSSPGTPRFKPPATSPLPVGPGNFLPAKLPSPTSSLARLATGIRASLHPHSVNFTPGQNATAPAPPPPWARPTGRFPPRAFGQCFSPRGRIFPFAIRGMPARRSAGAATKPRHGRVWPLPCLAARQESGNIMSPGGRQNSCESELSSVGKRWFYQASPAPWAGARRLRV